MSKVSIVLALALALLAHAVLAEKTTERSTPDTTSMAPVTPQTLKWSAGPPSLPSGAQAAALEGDMSKPGQFTTRLRVPKGYRVMPHYHPNVEHVTVLSGTIKVGMGDSFDEHAAMALPAGGFIAIPKGHHHFAYFPEETTIQLHGIGPWEITYVNPNDDPRKARAGAPRKPTAP